MSYFISSLSYAYSFTFSFPSVTVYQSGENGAAASGGSDIVPFRESKLTHLLMPLLGRSGLNGVAMVACVNPQSDDYDETLSILGKIRKEDVNTGHHQITRKCCISNLSR
jgi:hypothetical protein